MNNSISKNFTMGGLLKFTLPSMIMMVFVAIYSMFGSIMASQYIGENALSAINIVFPLFSSVLAVAIMLATGANAIIASNLGEGNKQKARENFTRIFLFGTFLGVLFSILSILFRHPIILFLGASADLVPLCETYLIGYALAFPFLFWQVYAQYFFVTVGKPTFGMVIVIIGGLLNILVSYVTIAVLKIGILGAALGVGISYFIPGFIFFVYFLTHKKGLLYFVKPKKHKLFLTKTCTNGSSEMVTNLAIAAVTAMLNLLMMRLKGNDGIAAVSIITQFQFVLNSLYIGFGGGVAPIFAYANGEKNHTQVKNVFKMSMIFVSISSCVLVLLCLLFSTQIISIFLHPSSSAFSLAKNGFVIFSLGYLFAGTNIFASVFFTSLSNGKISALISFLRTFVFIVGMLLILPNLLGETGVWLSIPIAEILGTIVSIYLLKKYKNTYHY